jgi:hypothetical protein
MTAIARPIRLRHSKQWGASVPGHDVQPGHLIIIKLRTGKRRLGVVATIVHRAHDETLVSLVGPSINLPNPRKPK